MHVIDMDECACQCHNVISPLISCEEDFQLGDWMAGARLTLPDGPDKPHCYLGEESTERVEIGHHFGRTVATQPLMNTSGMEGRLSASDLDNLPVQIPWEPL